MRRQETTAQRVAGTPRPYTKILVGTDGSRCAERAAAHAVYLARELGAQLYAMNAINVQRAFHSGVHFGQAMGELKRSGKAATLTVKGMADEAGVECEEILASGRPHEAIARVSDDVDADLIVVGSVGISALERVLIGSEAESLMRNSTRPVLLVRGR